MNTYVKDAYFGCILIITEGNKWSFYKNLKRKPRTIMVIDSTDPELANVQVEYYKSKKIQYIQNEEEKKALIEWIKADNIAFAHECSLDNIPVTELDKIDAGNKGRQHWNELEKRQSQNAIVKYHNYLNEIKFNGFSEADYDVFMTLLSFIKDRETETIILTFKQLKEVMNCKVTSKQWFINALDHMYDKLGAINCRILNDDKIIRFTVFPTYIIDPENQTLTIKVNENFKFIFNQLNSCFTIFETSEFVRLSGKYNKILYMHLKQFKHGDGWWQVSHEEFRSIMDIPPSYSNRDVASKVLKPCIEALTPYFDNLKCETLYEPKQGKPVKGYRFTFTPQKRMIEQAHFTDNESLNNYARLNMNLSEERNLYKGIEKVRAKNKFNDFSQNIYDYDLLENKLLSN